MGLKVFNKLNCESRAIQPGVWAINVNRATGTITLSRALCNDLKISNENNGIQFAHDEGNENDWFVSFSKNDAAFPLRLRKSGGNYFSILMRNKFIANKLINSAKAVKSATLLVSSKTTNVDGFIWHKLVYKPLRTK